MQAENFKTVSNDFARFLGSTVKHLEDEIRSYFPLRKWFIWEEQNQPQVQPPISQQATSPSIGSQSISQTSSIKEKSVKSDKDIPCDSKTEELKSEFICNDLRSPDRAIRKQAQEELKNISHLSALKLLERALVAEGDTLRIIENLNVLETFRNGAPAAKQLFYKYAGYEDSAVRLTALWSVAKYRDEESFNLLSSHLKDKDPEARRRVLNYLCWNFEKKCLGFALAAFHDVDQRVRKTAAVIMGSLMAEEAITGLITLLNDPDKDVQVSANSSLKKITGKDFGFNASASRARKDDAIEDWTKWWRENQAKFGRPKYSVAAR